MRRLLDSLTAVAGTAMVLAGVLMGSLPGTYDADDGVATAPLPIANAAPDPAPPAGDGLAPEPEWTLYGVDACAAADDLGEIAM